ncbi:MAG: OB-fold domain-containing protein [Spongiibacteraceae bacterium]
MSNFEVQWQKNLEEGVLRLPQCGACKQWNWYPLPVCRGCGKTDFIWTEIPLSGTLFSWTRVHRNFTGQDMGPMPYTVALINLDGVPGARVPARFMGENPLSLQLDHSVNLVYQQIQGKPVLCFNS